MKLIIIIFISLTLFGSTLQPVNYVDIKKFSGLWYEIARTYNSFEKDCVASTVEYNLTENQTYDVKNRCFKFTIGGERILYSGTAKAQENKNMSKIDMTYFWIFTQEYQVIYLEEDYSTAIVTDSELDKLWIMHRKPFLHQKKIDNLVSFLANYMDTQRLIFTPQDKQGRYK